MLVDATAVRGDILRLASCTLYGVTLVILYSVSTIYHTVREPRLKYLFRILDHSSIFLVIPGTYTPFTLISLPAPLGREIFFLVRGLAVGGTILKVIMTGRLRILGPMLYLLMGWLIVLGYEPLSAAISPRGIH